MEGRGRVKLQYQSPKVLIWINHPSNLALTFMFCLSPKKSLIRFAISLPNTWVALKITILNHNITTKSNNFYSCFFLVVFKVEGRTNLFFFSFFLWPYDISVSQQPQRSSWCIIKAKNLMILFGGQQ